MKRILYLSRGGYSGGSQRQLYYVVGNLDHDYKPVVVCRSGGPFVSELHASGVSVSVLRLRPWRKFPAALYRYLDAERLVRFARKRNVALVHSSDLWLNKYSLWVAHKLRIPSILHVRTPVSPEQVHKHCCNEAAVLVAISQRVRRNLISAGIAPEKISLIDDAVDLQVFKPDSRAVNVLRRDYAPRGETMIGIVGKVKPSKYQLELLEAAAQVVRDSSKRVTFFIIGDIYSYDYFRKLKRFIAKNRLDNHVVFTGRREDMSDVLCSLDILVSLSGGSVMFEGMACSKCVVSAGFTSKRDSVHIQDGKTGILLESRLSTDLAQTLLELIGRRNLREQIGHQAREWATANLCRNTMAAKTQELYDRLLKV